MLLNSLLGFGLTIQLKLYTKIATIPALMTVEGTLDTEYNLILS